MVVPFLVLYFVLYALKVLFVRGLSWLMKGGLGDNRFTVKLASKSPYTRKFYGVLVEAVGDEVIVFGQCRVADLINVNSKQNFGAFNRIKSKHVDFVLVQKSDWSLLCAIELDDKSHRRYDRMKRDNFLDDLFEQVGLPLFRFTVKKEYSVKDIHKGLGI